MKVDHAMRCMDSMLSYGDHSAVIGGIYENVHSMEVSVCGWQCDYSFVNTSVALCCAVLCCAVVKWLE